MLKLVEKFGFIKEENDMKKYLNWKENMNAKQFYLSIKLINK